MNYPLFSVACLHCSVMHWKPPHACNHHLTQRNTQDQFLLRPALFTKCDVQKVIRNKVWSLFMMVAYCVNFRNQWRTCVAPRPPPPRTVLKQEVWGRQRHLYTPVEIVYSYLWASVSQDKQHIYFIYLFILRIYFYICYEKNKNIQNMPNESVLIFTILLCLLSQLLVSRL